ncbi:hypothetical protein BGX26_006082 [Mortierella sp. AD094]|nr:hypothetical protein BGX26_006082 [Mortierella sp. AD094]
MTPVEGCGVRLMTEEYTQVGFNKEKFRLYEVTQLISFKSTAESNHQDNKEIDTKSLEQANNLEDMKIASDGAIILREGQQITSNLIKWFPEHPDLNKQAIGWSLQAVVTLGQRIGLGPGSSTQMSQWKEKAIGTFYTPPKNMKAKQVKNFMSTQPGTPLPIFFGDGSNSNDKPSLEDIPKDTEYNDSGWGKFIHGNNT